LIDARTHHYFWSSTTGDRHEFNELKPKLKILVLQRQLKWFLSEAKINKRKEKLKKVVLLLRAYEAYLKQSFNKFLSEESTITSKEPIHADNNREMHKIDEALYFMKKKNNQVELTDNGIKFQEILITLSSRHWN
jgi:preprotein translocase subunit SecA